MRERYWKYPEPPYEGLSPRCHKSTLARFGISRLAIRNVGLLIGDFHQQDRKQDQTQVKKCNKGSPLRGPSDESISTIWKIVGYLLGCLGIALGCFAVAAGIPLIVDFGWRGAFAFGLLILCSWGCYRLSDLVFRHPSTSPVSAVSSGAAILAVRTAAGLSQTELAAKLKTAQANIARLEKSGSIPSTTTLLRIAKATGHKLTITFTRNARPATSAGAL